MTASELVAELEKLGCSIQVSEDGKPRVTGNGRKVPPELREQLPIHRAELVDRFRPHPSRRIVLLDESGEVVKVLEECRGTGHIERIRHHAANNPGCTIAGEWRQVFDGRERWTRFLTTRRDASEMGQKVSGMPG